LFAVVLLEESREHFDIHAPGAGGARHHRYGARRHMA
jgi:hypothetical protein